MKSQILHKMQSELETILQQQAQALGLESIDDLKNVSNPRKEEFYNTLEELLIKRIKYQIRLNEV